MKAVTCLFYAFATLCLGAIAIVAGAPRVLGILFRDQPTTDPYGILTYPTEPWRSPSFSL